jgi:hypothetical protein
MNYRKENPLPKDQTWVMGPEGEEKVQQLPPACEYNEALGNIVCKGGFGGMFGGGMSGGGFGSPGTTAPAPQKDCPECAVPPGSTF